MPKHQATLDVSSSNAHATADCRDREDNHECDLSVADPVYHSIEVENLSSVPIEVECTVCARGSLHVKPSALSEEERRRPYN